VQPIRVLLAEPPTSLRTVVRDAVGGQPDLVVVGESRGEVDLLLRAAVADVVIVRTDTCVSAVAERLLDEYPRIAVLAVDVGAARGRLYRLGPHVTDFDRVTPAGLVSAIRLATAHLPI
jgi:DNA-binding NarL/FixJ family response regulator